MRVLQQPPDAGVDVERLERQRNKVGYAELEQLQYLIRLARLRNGDCRGSVKRILQSAKEQFGLIEQCRRDDEETEIRAATRDDRSPIAVAVGRAVSLPLGLMAPIDLHPSRNVENPMQRLAKVARRVQIEDEDAGLIHAHTPFNKRRCYKKTGPALIEARILLIPETTILVRLPIGK